MTCYYPIQGYRARSLNSSGKRSIVFNLKDGYQDMPLTVPCGRCVGCRLEKSRQWAIRCLHESQMFSNNCFITLTYSPEFLPTDGSLKLDHFQKFMKRLRKNYLGIESMIIDGVEEFPIRFFHCGEYGEKFGRPHYHALLFNFDFDDRVLHQTLPSGFKIYTSEKLAKLWPFGYSSIGDVSFESAAYVARYIMKKVTGDNADEHYSRIDCDTGELFKIAPEYTTMSRRPGIGKAWFDTYGLKDCYNKGFITVRGKKMFPPKYYDAQFEVVDPVGFEKLKFSRKKLLESKKDDNTLDRLRVKEKCKLSQLSLLKRNLD